MNQFFPGGLCGFVPPCEAFFGIRYRGIGIDDDDDYDYEHEHEHEHD